jgi:hypothetical protein
VNPDPRAYPVSSYSYMIVPRTTAAGFTAAKGETLGRFILYFLCTGQQKAKQLGYSPLPKNLVQFGFDAERTIPGAPAPPPINQCANPTITGGFTTNNAPPPPPSEHVGAVRPNLTGGGGGPSNGGQITQSNAGGGSGGSGSGSGVTDTTLADGTSGTGAETSGDTTGTGTGTGTGSQQQLASAPISVARHADGVSNGVYVLVALAILLAVFVPPVLAMILRRDPTPAAAAPGTGEGAAGAGPPSEPIAPIVTDDGDLPPPPFGA